MLNQQCYGKMDVNPVPQEGGAVLGICIKCKIKFLLEKLHKEVIVQGMFYRRKPDKNLTPTTPTDKVVHRLCLSCFDKLNKWFAE